MSKISPSEKKVFNPYLDLETSRSRIAAFGKRYELVECIEDIRRDILLDPKSDEYSNPVDYADFAIAEVLNLNVEVTLANGDKVCTRSARDINQVLTPASKLIFDQLFDEMEYSESGDRELWMIAAVCKYDGIGIKKDWRGALDDASLLTFNNYAPALDTLASYYLRQYGNQDLNDVTELLEGASRQKYPPSQHKLGLILLDLANGDVQREKRAVAMVAEAALAGYPPAQQDYATFLRDGDGVDKNQEEANKFFELAKAQGYPFENLVTSEYFLNDPRNYENKDLNNVAADETFDGSVKSENYDSENWRVWSEEQDAAHAKQNMVSSAIAFEGEIPRSKISLRGGSPKSLFARVVDLFSPSAEAKVHVCDDEPETSVQTPKGEESAKMLLELYKKGRGYG